ncbi:MAG: phosphatidate cytidylyltransferase [Pseudomonadota bacterium]
MKSTFPKAQTRLAVRLWTAALLIPLVVGTVIIGGRLYSAVIAFMAVLLIFEWTRMVEGAEFSRGFYALSVTTIITIFLAASGQFPPALIVICVGGVAATLIERSVKRKVPWPLAGALYLLVPAVSALYIRHGAGDGRALTLLLFGVVWATDSGAYLAGKVIGGPKLWPALSPKKTWAGAAGGFMAGILVAVVIGPLLGAVFLPLQLAILGGLLSFAAIAGDLTESAVKRFYGVKDSGGVFPGHGGVLDRLDGFLMAVCVLALFTLLRHHNVF